MFLCKDLYQYVFLYNGLYQYVFLHNYYCLFVFCIIFIVYLFFEYILLSIFVLV
jgi:hypothetical protein